MNTPRYSRVSPLIITPRGRCAGYYPRTGTPRSPARPVIRILELPREYGTVRRFACREAYLAAQHVLAANAWTGVAAIADGTRHTTHRVYVAGYPVCDRASLGKAQRTLRRARRRQAMGHAILGWLERHHWLSPVRVEALRRARAAEER